MPKTQVADQIREEMLRALRDGDITITLDQFPLMYESITIVEDDDVDELITMVVPLNLEDKE